VIFTLHFYVKIMSLSDVSVLSDREQCLDDVPVKKNKQKIRVIIDDDGCISVKRRQKVVVELEEPDVVIIEKPSEKVDKPPVKRIKKKCVAEGCKLNECGHHQLCKKHAGKRLIEKQDCAICMDGELNVPLSCGHWIHADCVIKSAKKECPICKEALKFTKEQQIIYRRRKAELRINEERESFAEVVRDELRDEEYRRNRRQHTRRRDPYIDNLRHFNPHVLMNMIRIISDNGIRLINREIFIEMLLHS
jgi:hypothetical protein